MESAKKGDGLGDHAAVMKAGQVTAIEVIAASDHHFDASFGQASEVKACVGQGGGGGFEDQELLGLATLDGARHDAVLGGVEGQRRVEVAAAAGRDPVSGG